MDVPKLTEREAIKHLVYWLPAGYVYMPRFAPGGWWENDLCAVTKAGYWTEFEIKLSRQDFLKDKAKSSWHYEGIYPNQTKIVENKHELLANSERGPARFYYVVGPDVATAEDMPPWAGLLIFEWTEYEWARNSRKKDGRWEIKELKKAPRRHARKEENLINQIYRAAWYRGIGKLL
jgi:hypothetical protein